MAQTKSAGQPRLTHLQALVLTRLSGSDWPKGRELRDYLLEHGVKQSRPAFYILMGRLEDSGCVESQLHSRPIRGQSLNERAYKITDEGRQLLNSAFAFYDQLQRELTQPQH